MSNVNSGSKPANPTAKKSLVGRLLHSRLTFSVAILLVMLGLCSITIPNFFDVKIIEGVYYGRIPTILDEAGTLIIVTLGMTLVVAVSGGVDISVGAIMAIGASFCGLMLNGSEYRTEVFHSPLVLALFVGLLGGALCGAFNGFLVSGLKIQPMIATLVLFTAGRSIAKQITFGQTIYIMNPVYKWLGVQIPGVPIRTTILISIVMIVIVVLFTKLTSFGLYVQSVGINGSSSRLVGLNSRVIKFMAFVICGILAGMAGLVGASSLGSVNSGELGKGIEMDAILAVALGGNLLGGGKFSIAGSVIGAYTIQTITTILYNIKVGGQNIPSQYVIVIKALIIIVIIVANSDVFKEKIAKSARKVFNKNVTVGGSAQ